MPQQPIIDPTQGHSQLLIGLDDPTQGRSRLWHCRSDARLINPTQGRRQPSRRTKSRSQLSNVNPAQERNEVPAANAALAWSYVSCCLPDGGWRSAPVALPSNPTARSQPHPHPDAAGQGQQRSTTAVIYFLLLAERRMAGQFPPRHSSPSSHLQSCHRIFNYCNSYPNRISMSNRGL